MSIEPKEKTDVTDATLDAAINWIVQVGPQVSGENSGYYRGAACVFYLALGQGDPGKTYAWYSTTYGSSWVAIPNNRAVGVSGSSIEWRYNAPAGVTFKFLMGPS